MATMIEKRLASLTKEAEKLQKQMARREATYQKKLANAEKHGVATWTSEDLRAFDRTLETTPEGFIKDKKAVDKRGAYFDLMSASRDLEETKLNIERNEKKLKEITGEVEAKKQEQDEEERVNDMEAKFFQMTAEDKARREAEYEAWLKWFKAECLKDGVVIEEVSGWYIKGKAKSGKRFSLEGNSGYTERSRHCYSFWLEGDEYWNHIFTSGDFSTAYKTLKK